MAALWLSLAVASEGYSSLRWAGFWLWWLLLQKNRLQPCSGFQSLRHMGSAVAVPGSGAQAQWLWHTDFVAPWRVGSSQTRGPVQPVSPALQGGFLNPTGPPGKLPGCFLKLDTFFTAIKILKGLFREAGEGRIGSSGLADADQHMYHG